MCKIKTGIIGAGRIGVMHAENIQRLMPQAEIKSIADIFADKIEDWAKSLDIKIVTEDYRDIINDPEIEAVIICSPTETHARMTIEASNAGKHVFCEKPIDLKLSEIEKAIDAIDKAGIKFQLGFNRRFDKNISRLRDLVINEQRVGKVYLIKITSWDPAPPSVDYLKSCGGIFLDMAIHDFDMARFISGSEVVEVSANAEAIVNPELSSEIDDYYDTTVTSLKFENGAIGVIDNCRKFPYGHDQRIEVLGSKGSISTMNPPVTTTVIRSEKGKIGDNIPYFFVERYREAFIEEFKQFFNAIINNTGVPVGAIDGMKSIEIGLAAQKSAKEGRFVKLSEI